MKIIIRNLNSLCISAVKICIRRSENSGIVSDDLLKKEHLRFRLIIGKLIRYDIIFKNQMRIIVDFDEHRIRIPVRERSADKRVALLVRKNKSLLVVRDSGQKLTGNRRVKTGRVFHHILDGPGDLRLVIGLLRFIGLDFSDKIRLIADRKLFDILRDPDRRRVLAHVADVEDEILRRNRRIFLFFFGIFLHGKCLHNVKTGFAEGYGSVGLVVLADDVLTDHRDKCRFLAAGKLGKARQICLRCRVFIINLDLVVVLFVRLDHDFILSDDLENNNRRVAVRQ